MAGTHSRCSVERSKGELFFFVRRVDVIAVQNVLPEIFMNHTGVVAYPQLPQPRDPQEQVLVVDERMGAAPQALVVVPLCPVQTVQEWALSKLDQKLGWAWSSLLLTLAHGLCPCTLRPLFFGSPQLTFPTCPKIQSKILYSEILASLLTQMQVWLLLVNPQIDTLISLQPPPVLCPIY